MLFRLTCALTSCLIVDLLSGPANAQTAGPLVPQGPKRLGAGAIFTVNGGASQGRSIALSADGNTAIVGGDSDYNSTGAAWVFVRSNGAWSQQQKLTTNDVVTQFAISVGVSGDGNTAIVGLQLPGCCYTETGWMEVRTIVNESSVAESTKAPRRGAGYRKPAAGRISDRLRQEASSRFTTPACTLPSRETRRMSCSCSL